MKNLKQGGFLMLGASALSMLLAGCETPEQSALAGAATGAVMGGMLKGDGRNMARGAAIGAAGGYVLGKYGEAERRRGSMESQGGYSSAPVYSAPPPQREVYYSAPAPRPHYHQENVPYGRYSRTPGYVYSPFTGQLIDVRGIPRGAQVVDPSCGRSFLNP